jgi:hypothetical protein
MSAMSTRSAKMTDIAMRGLRAERLPRRPPTVPGEGRKSGALEACCGRGNPCAPEEPLDLEEGDSAESASAEAAALAAAGDPSAGGPGEPGVPDGFGLLAGSGTLR